MLVPATDHDITEQNYSSAFLQSPKLSSSSYIKSMFIGHEPVNTRHLSHNKQRMVQKLDA